MKTRACSCIWLIAAALAGCASETQYVGNVHVTSPELVSVAPGVEVVADADDPVFYADGYYWLYRNGVWLRSGLPGTGFARIDLQLVPDRLRRIQEPRSYAHYMHRGEIYARGEQLPPHPTPPQPSRPAQPNPMPGQQPTTPEPGRPQGAETGTTPQTGG
jgi:hypothetical protein